MAISDSHKLLSDEHVDSVVGNQIQTDLPDDYWCEPLNVFDYHKCTDLRAKMIKSNIFVQSKAI